MKTDYETMQDRLLQADVEERRQLLSQLQGGNRPEWIILIAQYLSDPAPAVCEAAVTSLLRCDPLLTAKAAALHLRSDEPAERGYAFDVLTGLGEPAIDVIVELLNDPNPNLRKYAADMLGQVRSPRSAPALIQRLAQDEPNVEAAKAEALGELGKELNLNSGTVSALLTALDNQSDWVVIAILNSLGKIGGQEALLGLVQILERQGALTPSVWVYQEAISSLGRIGWEEPNLSLPPLIAMLRQDIEQRSLPGPLRDEILIAMGRILAKSESGRVSLREKDEQTLIPYAYAALDSPRPETRVAAVRCLGKLPNVQTTRLTPLLYDPFPQVREVALEVLTVRHGLHSNELINLALDPWQSVGFRIQALHWLLKQSVQGSLVFSPTIQAELVRSFQESGEIDYQAVVLSLLLSLGYPDSSILLLECLEKMDAEEVETFFDAVRPNPISSRIQVLGECLKLQDGDLRAQAFLQLFPAKTGKELCAAKQGPELLLLALSDTEPLVRIQAVELAAQALPQDWAQALINEAGSDPDFRVRLRVADACTHAPLPKIQADLLALLTRDQHPAVQRIARRAALNTPNTR